MSYQNYKQALKKKCYLRFNWHKSYTANMGENIPLVTCILSILIAL